MLAPPQDRKDCHVSGNVFVSLDGSEPVTLCNFCAQKAMKSLLLWRGLLFACLLGVLSLELVKFFPWGCINAPVGVAPEALEEWKHSSKGCEHNACMVGWLAGLHSVRFSQPRHYFSQPRRSFQLLM